MDPISLILLSLSSLSIVLKNPALGGGSSLQLGQTADLLTSLVAAIAQGEQGYEHLKEFTDSVRAMAAEGRGPTKAEWANLIARRDQALDRMARAKLQIEQEERDRKADEEQARLQAEADAAAKAAEGTPPDETGGDETPKKKGKK